MLLVAGNGDGGDGDGSSGSECFVQPFVLRPNILQSKQICKYKKAIHGMVRRSRTPSYAFALLRFVRSFVRAFAYETLYAKSQQQLGCISCK